MNFHLYITFGEAQPSLTTLEAFISDNAEDIETCEKAEGLDVGESFMAGGGAGALVTVRRATYEEEIDLACASMSKGFAAQYGRIGADAYAAGIVKAIFAEVLGDMIEDAADVYLGRLMWHARYSDEQRAKAGEAA